MKDMAILYYKKKYMNRIYQSVSSLALLLGISFSAIAGDMSSHQSIKSLSFLDGVGRQVDVSLPVQRVVAANGTYGPEMLCALGVSEKIVGVSDHATNRTLHLSSFLRGVPGVGKSRLPNTEGILQLNPQIVLLYEAFYPYTATFLHTLDQAGIQTIVMDYHLPAVYEPRLRLMGKLMDKEERAEELIAFEKRYFNYIREQVGKTSSDEKPLVYLESYKDYQALTAKSPDHHLLDTCGGINIFSDLSFTDSTHIIVSPETVIERDPDVIIKHISTDLTDTGYGATSESALAKVRATIMNRPGWGKISAVKNGKVYVLDTGTKAVHPSVYCSYIAKWSYPEKFEELDPRGVYKEWMEKFLNIQFQGIYAYPEKPVGPPIAAKKKQG